jgi:glutaredoxin
LETVIYSKPNCPYCTNAKNLFERLNIPYEEKVLGIDFTRDDLLEMFPGAKTFPQIIYDGEYVGGFAELAKRFG